VDVLDREQSLGCVGMRERAALIGASFVLESAVGHGTTVTMRIPQANSVLRMAQV
jgi:signal transduction histidine kinase